MKIVQEGVTKRYPFVGVHVQCKNCGCIVELEEVDVKWRKLGQGVTCPTCKKIIPYPQERVGW